ncbi:hypothetical protein D3C71_1364520 [compost metagenome]
MAVSVVFSCFARRRSEKPFFFRASSVSLSMLSSDLVSSSSSIFTISSICTRNHGSILVSANTSSTLRPMAKASPTYQMRSGPGSPSSFSSTSRSCVFSFRPSTPTSRPRRAFWNDSWKVRPMAITSPTDFICVVRRESACGNFSKAKRGILVTT